MTWEEVTALATLALAGVTSWLAWTTRKLALSSTAETAANWQPVLVPDITVNADELTEGVDFDPFTRVLSLRWRNVGRGPALNVSVLIWRETIDGVQPTDLGGLHRGHSPSNVVPPGDTLVFDWARFTPPAPPPDDIGLAAWSPMDGRVTYGDVAYSRYSTKFKLGFRPNEVTLVDHWFEGTAAAHVTTRDRLKHRALLWVIRNARPGRRPRQRFAIAIAKRWIYSGTEAKTPERGDPNA